MKAQGGNDFDRFQNIVQMPRRSPVMSSVIWLRNFLSTPRRILVCAVGLIVTWAALNIAWALKTNNPVPLPDAVIGMIAIVAPWWFISGRRLYEDFGARGLMVWTSTLGLVYFFALICPFYDQHSATTLLTSGAVGVLVALCLTSTPVAAWLIERERALGFLVFFGTLAVGCCAFTAYTVLANLAAPAQQTVQADQTLPPPPETTQKTRKHKKTVAKTIAEWPTLKDFQ